MDMNKGIPSPSDGSVTSKIASFTPLRFAQISGHPELAVPPNQLLLNGKVSLDPVLYNDGNYPALKPHYGYPVSVLPSLHCSPEKPISMGVNKPMPLPSDTVVASKVTSFTPLMFAQFNGGQEFTVPPNQFPPSGKLSLNPNLCNGSNGLAPKPQYGYPISVLPNLNSLPEKTACMDVNKTMPLPSTPVIVEKKKFVRDRFPREVIDLVDEIPGKEDKQEKGKWQPLVHNLAEPNISKPVVSYSSEHLVPSQIVSFQQQMVDRGIVPEEIATWQSTLKKRMDLCFVRPTVKSSAFLPAVPSDIAFYLEPTIQSPCEHVMTSRTISSLNQRASKGDMQEKDVPKCQHPLQNKVELCFSNSVGSPSSEPRVPSQVAPSQQKQSEVNAIISFEAASSQQKKSEVNAIISFEAASSQQKQSEVNAIVSSEELPTQELDVAKQSKNENQRIDLNKTLQQKSKRKKHRPKVIREGKPARTPKPKTPKPVTPKRAKDKEENPSGKRKYVRKKKVHNSPDNPTDALGEIVNQNNASGTKSIRRRLNFDSENLQARNGCLVSASTLTCNAESQAQKESVPGPSTRSSTKSTLHHCQGPEVLVGISSTGITLDLNNSMNEMLNEFVNQAENPALPLQTCRREVIGTNQMLDGYRGMPENRIISPRPSKRELIRKNLNELAQKNEYLKISANPERSLESGQNRSDSHKISDVMLKSTKRGHNPVYDAHFSASINITYANNGIDQVSECHDTGSNDQYLSENCKKRRIENEQKGQNRGTSSAASMTYKPLINSRRNQVVLNNSEFFTFADAQRLMALEKQQASECMLSFAQAESNSRPTLPVQVHNSTSVSATMDCNYRSTLEKQSGYSSADCTHTTKPVKQSGQSHVDYNQPPTPGKPIGGIDNQESEICNLQPCIEDIVVETSTRMKPKNRTKKKQNHLVNPQSLKTNHLCLLEHEAAAFNSVSSPGQKAPRTTLDSGNSRERKSLFQIGSSLDYQSSSSFNESLIGCATVGATVPYGDPLDDIIQKLKCLNINKWHDGAPTQAQNALVPYDGGGVMVPYESLLDITRKRRPRAKVDLDPETNRVWKLLMGKEDSDGRMDMDKEKWWEEERRVFCGRVDSFIARMHLVQGDRRFSQWKGSVVDSVVGVFLTQNVSDHLSSSAYMALAARFPLKSRDNNWRPGAEKTNTSGEQQERCMSASENATKWQESMLHKELDDRDSVVIIGEKERANSHESFGSNIGAAIADYSKGKCLGAHQRELEIGHESPDSRTDTLATVIGSTSLAEVKGKRSVEDVVSSQNSVVSSQYSSEYQVQAADQNGSSSFSNSEGEELIIGSVCNGMDSSTSFTELLRIAELGTHVNKRIPPTDYHGAMDRFAQLDVDKRHAVLNQSEKLKGALPSMQTSDSYFHNSECDVLRVSCDPFVPSNFNNSKNSRQVGMYNASVLRDESGCPDSSTASGSMNTNKINFMDILCGPLANNAIENIGQQKLTITSETVPSFDSYKQISKQHWQPLTCLETEDYVRKCSSNNNLSERTGASLGESVSHQCSHLQHECTEKLQRKEKEANFQVENTQHAAEVPCQKQNSQNQQICPDLQNNQRKALETVEGVESNFKNESYNFQKVSSETANNGLKAKKTKVESEKKKTYDWDSLRKESYCKGANKERSKETMDSLDWEAIRCADVKEISETIRERGMNNMLAERIKEFLNRLVRDHGSIDLEWLRDVEPDKAKDYLLSIRGLGLKSVECVRLLTLHNLAFPVDTNVGRICVRLGWVPLQPLPESLQLHLLEMYPILETIQKYLWPRLCKLDQRTLYELHYQMITFGKVFCTKSKPNCNACPMRGECKHFASAFASARLALPGLEEKSLMSSTIPIASEKGHSPSCKFPLPQLEGGTFSQERTVFNNCEPIIEEPATPEAECLETEKSAIEDAFFEDPDEIPTIKLNFEEFTQNLQNYMQVHNMDIQDCDMSKALVAIAPEAASIPMPKLKNVSRLRTEHQVYELPDSHPLMEGLDRREPDDPCSYLLAIWTPGETAQSTDLPKAFCDSQETGKLCDKKICFACNSIREAQAQTVRGTLLIPCRTAMRGSFPLNGTYFQVNEVFADHDTSRNPIDVPREWIWNLPRRTVYFGTSIPTIFKGLTTEGIQQCFWRGFVCVRGFDRATRAPKPLYARLHFPASKAPRNKKAAAVAARKE